MSAAVDLSTWQHSKNLTLHCWRWISGRGYEHGQVDSKQTDIAADARRTK